MENATVLDLVIVLPLTLAAFRDGAPDDPHPKTVPGPASVQDPKGDSEAWDRYWGALVALRESRFGDATTALGALDGSSVGAGRVLLARGVAEALTGNFDRARADLARARIPNSREPELWQYAVELMSGKSAPDHGIPIPRSLQKEAGATNSFSGIPGHMVQGGKDYSTSYASYVYYDFATPAQKVLKSGGNLRAPELSARKQKAGRWFANRAIAAPELASRNFARSNLLVKKGDFREARAFLDLALLARSADPVMLAASGDLWAAVGRPATARREYTIALTSSTIFAKAYAGRAMVAAALGDGRRAMADLKLATRHGKGEPDGLRRQILEALKAQAAPADPGELLAALDEQALAGAAVETLVPLAERLHRSQAVTEVRYDEVYQDRIRKLEDAVRADLKSIDARLALARYLLDESGNRGETVEPRRGRRPFRWQQSREAELGRAARIAQAALELDPRNAESMVTLAAIQNELGRSAAAEQLIDKAVQTLGAKDPQAIRMLARFRSRQIGNLLATAGALRAPTFSTNSWTENRSDGIWRITETTRHDPTAGDLANASALEHKARQLLAETRNLMARAIEASRGTLQGMLLESDFENWFGTRKRALAVLRQAVAKYPQELAAHDKLIDDLLFLGRKDEALEQEAVSWQLFQTTAAPLLARVWQNVRRDGWKAQVDVLQRARKLAPADARATAYLARARAAGGAAKEAAALLREAAALEYARLALDDRGEARSWPRRAEDLALAMRMRHLLAEGTGRAGNSGDALKEFKASVALVKRYPPDGIATLMFGAMLPDPAAPAIPVPAPTNGATLAAEAYLGAGRVLKARGKTRQAQGYFQSAASLTRQYGELTPNIGTGKGDNNFGGLAGRPSAEALVELAKTEIANKDYKSAFQHLQAATQANPSRKMRGEINELTLKIIPHLSREDTKGGG